MALLLRPGDPLPALLLRSGKLDVKAHAGHYWAIATGPQAALTHLQSDELPLIKAQDSVAAQRLGADFHAGEPQSLLVLLDPAGTVVHSWADAPLPELLERARQKAAELAGR
jgi:hypothetical protein